jgi:hypothetical protein
MNNRNGNSNSAAAPVRPLDPMECEEWSAASVRACVCVCVYCYFLLFLVFIWFYSIYLLISFRVLSLAYTLLSVQLLLFLPPFTFLFHSFVPCYRPSQSRRYVVFLDKRFSKLGPHNGYPNTRGYRQPTPCKSRDRKPVRSVSLKFPFQFNVH